VSRNNALDCGEPNTCAFERLLGMQALENAEQFLLIIHIETDSVVFHEHNYLIFPAV
jgi:hypothetical protein